MKNWEKKSAKYIYKIHEIYLNTVEGVAEDVVAWGVAEGQGPIEAVYRGGGGAHCSYTKTHPIR